MTRRRIAIGMSGATACLLFAACGPMEEALEAEASTAAWLSPDESMHGPSHARCTEPVLVADLSPSPNVTNLVGHAEVDGALFVSIFVGVQGTYSLWRLEDVSRGREPRWESRLLLENLVEQPSPLLGLGRRLLFTHDDGVHGRELWTSDGTPEGTQLLVDIYAGSASAFPSNPSDFLKVGGKVYFSADDGVHGRELWRTDGTPGGTRLVADIAPGLASSSPGPFVVDGSWILFAADDGAHGRELWKTDGTRSGTRLVEDIAEGSTSSSPELLLRVSNNQTFFTADDGIHGRELWKTDGTRSGTRIVEDIRQGNQGSDIQSLVAAGSRLYFTANDGLHGTEPWVSQGSAKNTRMVEDIRPGAEGSAPRDLTALGKKLIFTADNGTHGREPWRSDGTPGGTRLLKDISPGAAPGYAPPAMLTEANGQVFFYADDTVTGYEPWVTDGTPSGTHLVKDIHPGPGNSISGDPDPIYPVRDGFVAFRVFVPSLGVELAWTDGTRSNTRVTDIAPGALSSSPGEVFVAGRWAYFTADDFGLARNELRALPLACF